MQTAMAESWTTQFGSMSEKLFLATTLTIVGFVIVFIALIIIIFCIMGMSASIRYFSGNDKRSGHKDKTVLPKGPVPETPQISDLYIDVDDNEDEIIAVISAAITTARASEKRFAPDHGFRVRSIRRV